MGTRALVLGGGGGTGNAWLIGVVAGLLEGGVDVTAADLVVGTSAGATAAAQVLGGDPARLLAQTLVAPPARTSGGAPGGAAPSGGRGQVADHMARTAAIIAAAHDPADLRRRLGAAALELDAGGAGDEHSARWRTIVAARLPSPDWPDRPLLITAIDARTAEPVVLDRASGVDLVDAVAASTSSEAPYRIGERRLIDGGYRRNENADLAAGHDDVLVLSPLGGRTRTPLAWGQQLDAQVDELRAAGSRVEVVLPDAAAEPAMGLNAMDPSLRPDAARAGHAQGLALAPVLAPRWA